jgi:hypothetical protein
MLGGISRQRLGLIAVPPFYANYVPVFGDASGRYLVVPADDDIQLGLGTILVAVHPGASAMADLGTVVKPFRALWLVGGGTAIAPLNIQQGQAPTSPQDGDVWHETSLDTLQMYVSGIKHTLGGTLFVSKADAATTAGGSASELTLIGTGVGTLTLPANFFEPGKTLRFRADGYFRSTDLGPTLNVKFKFGSTSVLTTGATALGLVAATDRPWRCTGTITCRTTGATGTVHGQGVWEMLDLTTAIGSPTWIEMVRTGALTVDTTAAIVVDLTHQWGTSNASNIVTCTNFAIEVVS